MKEFDFDVLEGREIFVSETIKRKLTLWQKLKCIFSEKTRKSFADRQINDGEVLVYKDYVLMNSKTAKDIIDVVKGPE